jgi:hypothetical protein
VLVRLQKSRRRRAVRAKAAAADGIRSLALTVGWTHSLYIVQLFSTRSLSVNMGYRGGRARRIVCRTRAIGLFSTVALHIEKGFRCYRTQAPQQSQSEEEEQSRTGQRLRTGEATSPQSPPCTAAPATRKEAPLQPVPTQGALLVHLPAFTTIMQRSIPGRDGAQSAAHRARQTAVLAPPTVPCVPTATLFDLHRE